MREELVVRRRVVWTKRNATAAGIVLAALVVGAIGWRWTGVVQMPAPQPTLPTERLAIEGKAGARHVYNVEMATTLQEMEAGLMSRPRVPAGTGMVFLFGAPMEIAMWMKDTMIPLDMVFIGANDRIISVKRHAAAYSLALIPSGGPVTAALELAAGTIDADGIAVGDRVESKHLD